MLDKNSISFWFSQLSDSCEPRAQLQQDVEADVVIIGAGFTGLWTAYYLKKYKPSLRVALLDARIAGYGASGRNGGWLMGMIEDLEHRVSHLPLVQRQQAFDEVHGLVAEVQRVTIEEGIDCGFCKGGAVYAAARFTEQIPWAKEYLAVRQKAGHREEDYHWLNSEQTQDFVKVHDTFGAVYCQHVAAIQPAKLARGLANTVTQLGAELFENSAAESINYNDGTTTVKTGNGSVTAGQCVLATEGFAFGLGLLKPFIIPIQSKIIATEVLGEQQWQEIGFANRPTLCDFSRMQTYVQRSADNRLIFGARGVYEFGGVPFGDRRLSRDDNGFQLCERLMHQFFPSTKAIAIDDAWAGTFGMARSFSPHIVYDRSASILTAGGYGGEGVGASNLFGRTTAELICDADTQRTNMPWVHNATVSSSLKRWEPEPFRWLTYAMMARVFEYEEQLYVQSDVSQWKKRAVGRVAASLNKIL